MPDGTVSDVTLATLNCSNANSQTTMATAKRPSISNDGQLRETDLIVITEIKPVSQNNEYTNESCRQCLEKRKSSTGVAAMTIPSRPNKWRSNLAAIRILIACAMCNTITAVHFSAFPVYYVILTDYFDVSKALAGWVASLGIFMSFCGGMFISPAISLWKCRRVGAIGGLVIFCGMMASAFASSIFMLMITYGLIVGLGIASAVMCPMVEIQQQFRKNRPVAQGVSMIGFSMGSMLSSLLIANLLKKYSLGGTLIIHGAIMLHLIPLSFLFRRHVHTKSETSVPDNEKLPNSNMQSIVVETKDVTVSSMQQTKNEKEQVPSNKVTKFFREMFDFRPLTDVLFVSYMVGAILFRTATTVFLVNVPSRAVSLGMSMSESALLLSLVSIGQFSARVPTSIVANFISANARIFVVSFGIFVCGLAGVVSVWAVEFSSSAALSIFFGLGLGLSNTVVVTVLTDLFGTEDFAHLSAITNLFSAFVAIGTPPLAGWMYDVTRNYNMSFVFSGLLALTGAIFMGAIIPLKCRREKQKCDAQASL